MFKKIDLKKFEPFVVLAILIGLGYIFISTMGLSNFFSTLMNTAYSLLTDTVLFIMALAVIMGAFASFIGEFGIVNLLNIALSKIMRIFYKLPGVCSLGIITTYLSDNPAIISLAKDSQFRNKLTKDQLVVLCNLGTAFGMGLIVTTFFISVDSKFLPAVIIGNIGAFVGSIVSVRIMLRLIKNEEYEIRDLTPEVNPDDSFQVGMFDRVMNSLLEGGKKGVAVGLEIIPGVLIISTMVLMLTNGKDPVLNVYTGEANEGIAFLPYVASKMNFIIEPLFGFSSSDAISFPLASLGSTGAALGFFETQYISAGFNSTDVAVFTAIGMTWSGYLSTHIGMMDSLGARKLASKAIIAHTIAGLIAAIFTNYLFMLVSSLT